MYCLLFFWSNLIFSQEKSEFDLSIKISIKNIFDDIRNDSLTLAWKKTLIKHEEFSQKGNLKGILEVMNCQGKILSITGNMTATIECYLKSLDLIERSDSLIVSKDFISWIQHYKGLVHANIGNCYIELLEYEKGISYYNKATLTFQNTPISNSITDSLISMHVATTYASRAGAYMAIEKIDSVESNISMMYRISDSSLVYPLNSFICITQSNILLYKKEYKKALDMIETAIELDSINRDMVRLSHNKMQKAKLLYLNGDEKQSVALFNECLTQFQSNEIKLAPSRVCLSQLYDIYLAKKDSITALTYLIRLNEINDTLNAINNQTKIESIFLVQEFRTLELDLARGKKEARLKEDKNKLKSALIGVSFILILLVILFIGHQMRKRFKRKIASGKKEIAYSSTQLVSKNEVINSTISKLETHLSDFSESDNVQLKSLLNDLKGEIKNEDFWDDFAIRFKDVDPGFHEKLISLPNPLTKSEIRLCTFIKLNFSTKEISNITKQSVNSINVAKYRLKSKLELDKNQTIESYFVNL